ncbi:MAG: hypothetical protein VYB54_09625 [Pseudomonadota bacterium]|nr:hypothetical protein [Pseudomonadota bacterium]
MLLQDQGQPVEFAVEAVRTQHAAGQEIRRAGNGGGAGNGDGRANGGRGGECDAAARCLAGTRDNVVRVAGLRVAVDPDGKVCLRQEGKSGREDRRAAVAGVGDPGPDIADLDVFICHV